MGGAGRSFPFADVPWNAPWYARHGWRTHRDPGPALRAVRDHEAALGLDWHGPRVVMVRSTHPG